MTSKEFITWLKGFSKAANSYNITPQQWETIVEELNKVRDPISFQDHTPGPFTQPSVMPKPVDIWYSTDTFNSIPKDKTILND